MPFFSRDPDGRVPGRCLAQERVDQHARFSCSRSSPRLDPPGQRAFYYGRVLEIPTPRWTAYDAKYFGVKMAADTPMQIQERAYTAPIWYTPPK